MGTDGMLKAPLDPLLPHQGISSECQWRKEPPDLEGSCEYIE
jgi:hypothetical protein